MMALPSSPISMTLLVLPVVGVSFLSLAPRPACLWKLGAGQSRRKKNPCAGSHLHSSICTLFFLCDEILDPLLPSLVRYSPHCGPNVVTYAVNQLVLEG